MITKEIVLMNCLVYKGPGCFKFGGIAADEVLKRDKKLNRFGTTDLYDVTLKIIEYNCGVVSLDQLAWEFDGFYEVNK